MIEDHTGSFFDLDVHVPVTPGGALAGLSFAAKDLFDVVGHVTGAGNPDWRRTHAAAQRTAPAITRLASAGARLIGKTHTDELAFSLEGANHHYGTPLNPSCPDRLPGGSSSGSVAAVACGLVDFALGTDTGGSVRVPASFCGVFGFRPSHGAIDITGVVPLAPSLDTVGWFARDAHVLARVGDTLLPPAPVRASTAPTRWLIDPALLALADAPVRKVLEAAISRMRAVVKVDSGLADATAQHACYRVVQGAELWREHGAWIERVAPVFGPAIAPRFADAATITRTEADAANSARSAFAVRLDALLGTDGILLLPAAPTLALPRTVTGAQLGEFYPRALGLGAIAGFAGAPQVVIPAGIGEGCPVGLSLVGPRGSDRHVLALAAGLARDLTLGAA